MVRLCVFNDGKSLNKQLLLLLCKPVNLSAEKCGSVWGDPRISDFCAGSVAASTLLDYDALSHAQNFGYANDVEG